MLYNIEDDFGLNVICSLFNICVDSDIKVLKRIIPT